MRIEYFQRNYADEVVAVGEGKRVILPFDFIAKCKPVVGDNVFLKDGEFFIGEESISELENVFGDVVPLYDVKI